MSKVRAVLAVDRIVVLLSSLAYWLSCNMLGRCFQVKILGTHFCTTLGHTCNTNPKVRLLRITSKLTFQRLPRQLCLEHAKTLFSFEAPSAW
jgi:hypothetical protein